jgi:molybdate transport system substrate-binding protein
LRKILGIISLFCLLWISCEESKSNSLVIATAANVQFAMEDLVQAFETETGTATSIILGSSGKLTAQIQEGAPFDLLVSANMLYPTTLHTKGFCTIPPKIYAYGQLVLWTTQPGLTPSMDILDHASIRHIALANPKTAPYGVAAMEVIDHFQLGDPVKKKLVFGESISQTNQFITSGAANLGFTALSVVRSPKMKNTGQWTSIPSSAHRPIEQGVALLKNGNNPTAARAFFDFLSSETAVAILKSYGYAQAVIPQTTPYD